MSTFREIISRVDDCRPNAFSVKTKFRWLTRLEGKIAADVLLLDIREIRALPHSYPEDIEKETLVDYPYDDLYDAWLGAMIDLENGDYSKYQNSMEHYNGLYGNFTLWFTGRYEPAQGCPVEPGYFITAYGMAVQKGYRGSVEEWLLSLIGPQGPRGIQGETGKSAYEYAVEGGYDGTEESFAERMAYNGKTAYEYAVEGGYAGTPEEFSKKLAAEYALKNHDHDEAYSPKNHDHAEAYSPKNHDHGEAYSPKNHDHAEAYSPKNHDHDGDYAAAGFGYGEKLTYYDVQDDTFETVLDEILAGMERYSAKQIQFYDPVGLIGNKFIGTLWKYESSYATLEAVTYTGLKAVKRKYKTWLPWEWENPPLNAGSEYLTGERYEGKPVYTKLVSLGALPNAATKSVSHGLSGVTVIRYQAFATNATDKYVQEFPFHNTAGEIVGKVYYSTDGVKVVTYDDLSGYTGVVQLWYTK